MPKHRVILCDNFRGVSRNEIQCMISKNISFEDYAGIGTMFEHEIPLILRNILVDCITNNNLFILQKYITDNNISINNKMKSNANTYRVLIEIVQNNIEMPISSYKKYVAILDLFSSILFHWCKILAEKYIIDNAIV